jgi:hypothetical protein
MTHHAHLDCCDAPGSGVASMQRLVVWYCLYDMVSRLYETAGGNRKVLQGAAGSQPSHQTLNSSVDKSPAQKCAVTNDCCPLLDTTLTCNGLLAPTQLAQAQHHSSQARLRGRSRPGFTSCPPNPQLPATLASPPHPRLASRCKHLPPSSHPARTPTHHQYPCCARVPVCWGTGGCRPIGYHGRPNHSSVSLRAQLAGFCPTAPCW